MLPAGLRLARRGEGGLLPLSAVDDEAEVDDDGDERLQDDYYHDSDLSIESAM